MLTARWGINLKFSFTECYYEKHTWTLFVLLKHVVMCCAKPKRKGQQLQSAVGSGALHKHWVYVLCATSGGNCFLEGLGIAHNASNVYEGFD